MPFATLSDIASLTSALPGFDEAACDAAALRQRRLTKSAGSLGRLEELALFMAGWRANPCPQIGQAQALIFAGNHGVCAQGVSPYPQEVTAQMVANFRAGGAAINRLCHAADAHMEVIPLDLDRPTADFTAGFAMTEGETLSALNRGAAAVDAGADVLILGEMGIGNSTVAAALAAALFGGPAAEWVGPGTGADAEGVRRKADVVEKGLARHRGLEPLHVLAAFGGREQAAICGAILAARAARIPVLLDGFICTAAASVLHGLDRRLLDHCLAGHVSAEPGHRRLLAALGKQAILDLDLRLGEGSGGALALGILRAALACHNQMATFAEAGISED
ncbi:nicotinate-nucleotide--dimethylbenzimidazole phosphoribosyltransferase [Pseudochelatococcus lubricantis]|uniref:Nicotinate-nucleotide--dimethylbenzimidazole phosphoribosyltransferase n=1 Tax=Pseudochelatococcus lubricantis TaxID=1538102 RepID=A0ABX0V027_9HYPH|nr:nicotinate-nucleotide--dimethylbenzimidazole phosphoribosyltransferase [Pseudochelatococcus lubricantis]